MSKQDCGVTEITYSLKRIGDKYWWMTDDGRSYPPDAPAFDSPEAARRWHQDRYRKAYATQVSLDIP